MKNVKFMMKAVRRTLGLQGTAIAGALGAPAAGLVSIGRITL